MAQADDAPLRELEQALQILINRLVARVPDASPARISSLVHQVHRSLNATARVDAHLIALTERRVLDILRGRQPLG